MKPSLAAIAISFAAARAKPDLVVNGANLAVSTTMATIIIGSYLSSGLMCSGPIGSDSEFSSDWDFEPEVFSRFFRASDSDITDIVGYSFLISC